MKLWDGTRLWMSYYLKFFLLPPENRQTFQENKKVKTKASYRESCLIPVLLLVQKRLGNPLVASI